MKCGKILRFRCFNTANINYIKKCVNRDLKSSRVKTKVCARFVRGMKGTFKRMRTVKPGWNGNGKTNDKTLELSFCNIRRRTKV